MMTTNFFKKIILMWFFVKGRFEISTFEKN